MNSDERILVVVLSATLSIGLLLMIICLVKVIQILERVKRITSKTEDFANKAEAVGEFFTKTSGPAAFVGALSKMARSYSKSKK